MQVCLKSKNLQSIDFAGFITISLSQLTEAGGERGLLSAIPKWEASSKNNGVHLGSDCGKR
jgi:hypothetical protein